MINQYLEQQIKLFFHYPPTSEQEQAIKSLSAFLLPASPKAVFILQGFAGTGKTALTGAVVKALDAAGQKCVLLAPTGRSAKILASYSGHPAYTIHKKIYRQKSFSNEFSNFDLNKNLHTDTLFIVDEASMISNRASGTANFGSGRLLEDLIQFVFSGNGCKLLIIGDTAQLPPIGETDSPALSASFLQTYGLETEKMRLSQTVRQMEKPGILCNATHLRKCIAEKQTTQLPKIRLQGFKDIQLLPGNELVDTLNACYEQDGMNDTIIICRSNKQANRYNNGIRNVILFREEELESGDVLMVAKNNYFWGAGNKGIEFIANGDTAIVKRIRHTTPLYGFHFADVVLAFPDYNDMEIEAKVLLETLRSDAPALPKEDNDRLFYTILEDYADIGNKREKMKQMKENPYYNALQVKYAYAITGHKAQGGQWKNVFLDQGYITAEMASPDYFRWLYTAFTRATQKLYLVNYPKNQIEEQ